MNPRFYQHLEDYGRLLGIGSAASTRLVLPNSAPFDLFALTPPTGRFLVLLSCRAHWSADGGTNQTLVSLRSYQGSIAELSGDRRTKFSRMRGGTTLAQPISSATSDIVAPDNLSAENPGPIIARSLGPSSAAALFGASEFLVHPDEPPVELQEGHGLVWRQDIAPGGTNLRLLLNVVWAEIESQKERAQ